MLPVNGVDSHCARWINNACNCQHRVPISTASTSDFQSRYQHVTRIWGTCSQRDRKRERERYYSRIYVHTHIIIYIYINISVCVCVRVCVCVYLGPPSSYIWNGGLIKPQNFSIFTIVWNYMEGLLKDFNNKNIKHVFPGLFPTVFSHGFSHAFPNIFKMFPIFSHMCPVFPPNVASSSHSSTIFPWQIFVFSHVPTFFSWDFQQDMSQKKMVKQGN